MVIVHTTVWIDYLRGDKNPETNWLDRELQSQRLGLTDLILCGVLQGVADPRAFAQVKDRLLNFQVFRTGGSDLAIAAAENCRALRQHGYSVRKTIDCLIATFCLRSNHQLLTRDRDFAPFETALGLALVHP
jgi:predicted nucleic acid-binding protein